MAKEIEKQEVATVADMNPQMAALLAGLAQSIQAIAPKPVITEASPEYRERLDKEGFNDHFDKPVYQNAFEAEARGLSKEVRYRASNLKPGKYINGRVSVEVDNAGVRILYPVKGDNMMINQSHWSDFSDLINKIWSEMLVTA